MKWYHGTNKDNKEEILKTGFIPAYGRFGNGVYFTNNKAEAISFGENVIKIDTTENSSIVNMYYPDLVKMYPGISIEEEEGVTELEDYIVNKLSKDGVVLTYASGEKELCIYNTDIISIA